MSIVIELLEELKTHVIFIQSPKFKQNLNIR